MGNQTNTDDVIARIAAVPARIERATTGWTIAQRTTPPTPTDWSAADILAHLRAADEIVTARFIMMLVRENPFFLAFDERAWARTAGYAQADFVTSLHLYTLRRSELVAVLRRVAPTDWQRRATHEVTGEFTLAAGVLGFVEHEEEHCCQLEALAKVVLKEKNNVE
jgi:hypothetical protein